MPLVILLILFWLYQLSKKNRDRQRGLNRRPPAAMRTQDVAAGEPDAANGPEPALRDDSLEGFSREDEDGCIGGSIPHLAHQGQSASDEAGCLGGSIPHAHEERELAHGAPGTARVARIAPRQETPSRRPAARPTGGLRGRDLRQAVVMSEILARPRAMRRTGR